MKQKFLKVINRSHTTLQDLSIKRCKISPLEQQRAGPAIFSETDLIIMAVIEDTSPAQEIARSRSGLVEHAAAVAYSISDCQLINGSIYKDEVRHPSILQKFLFISIIKKCFAKQH